mgnify:CR=1 FL=1
MNIAGKVIVLTGGSLGIGRQLANTLIGKGARVLICGRSMETLRQAQEENPQLEIAQCDVTRLTDVQALLATAIELFGKVDILINNAAVFRRLHILDDYPLDKQLEEIDINLKGPVLVTNVFLKELLKSSEPVVVNLTSPSAYMPMAASQIYSATKSAIQSWTRSLQHQLRDTPMRVVELNPPAVDTRMNSDNPDLAGMKLMSPEKFAKLAVEGLEKGKQEILISHASIMKRMSRFAPGFAFKVINKS